MNDQPRKPTDKAIEQANKDSDQALLNAYKLIILARYCSIIRDDRTDHLDLDELHDVVTVFSDLGYRHPGGGEWVLDDALNRQTSPWLTDDQFREAKAAWRKRRPEQAAPVPREKRVNWQWVDRNLLAVIATNPGGNVTDTCRLLAEKYKAELKPLTISAANTKLRKKVNEAFKK